MNQPLIGLVDKKIRQLQRYNQITSQMIYEDIDGVGDLIDKRQKLITALDGVSVEIKKYVSDQAIEQQDTIKRLMKFEDIKGLSEEMLELQNKINETKRLTDEINKNDKKAYGRIKAMRDDLLDEMSNSQKNKKIIDYFSSTSVNVNKGNRLNISK